MEDEEFEGFVDELLLHLDDFFQDLDDLCPFLCFKRLPIIKGLNLRYRLAVVFRLLLLALRLFPDLALAVHCQGDVDKAVNELDNFFLVDPDVEEVEKRAGG